MADPNPSEAKTAPTRAKVVPFQAKHLPEVFALYAEVFGPSGARDFEARWQWSQEANEMPDATRRWSLVDGDKVVGFLGTVPQRFRIAGRDVVVHSSCDFMVHPSHRFHGIALMKEHFRACDNSVSLDDMPATIALVKMMKAKQLGTATRWVRVLDARLARERIPRLSQVPAPLFAPATWALRAYDRARATVLLPRVRAIGHFDSRFDRFFHATVPPSAVTVVRDRAHLDWRYGAASPHKQRTIGIATDEEGELEGYVVSATSQDKSDPSGYIFELHAKNSAPAALFGALLTFACRQIRREGGQLARLHWMPSITGAPESVLLANHFRKRTHEHVLLAKFKDPALEEAASRPNVWDYGFGDAEASHSVGG